MNLRRSIVLQRISHPNVVIPLPPPTIISTTPTMESEDKLVKDVKVRLHSWVLLTVLDLNIVPSN